MPFPPGLLAHAELQLRRAYEHSAGERAREVADGRVGDNSGGAASTSTLSPADVAATNLSSPSDGITEALDTLRAIAVDAATRARDARDGDVDGEVEAKRRRKRGVDGGAGDGPDGRAGTPREKRNLAESAPARFNRDVRSLTSALRADWTIAYELIVARTIDASQAVARAEQHAARAQWRRNTIVSHHRTLRATVAVPPTDDSPAGDSPPEPSSTDTRWRGAVSGGGLEMYAEAAEEVGHRAWVGDALRWCADVATFFVLGGGAADAAVRSARRVHFEENGTRMSESAEAELRAGLRRRWSPDSGTDPRVCSGTDPRVCSGTDSKPTLVDVGSCWDYFRRHEDAFDVLALDLAPRRASVFRCDFLNVTIGTYDVVQADGTHAGAVTKDDGAVELKSIPRNYAGALVMSLVLSYVPTPLQRGEMVRRAREVLMDDGRGVLLIVTPHSTDKGHCAHKALPVLKEWRASIESMGFERIKYTRMRSVHCLAFRTVGVGPGDVKAGDAPPMRIAFDGPDWETKS